MYSIQAFRYIFFTWQHVELLPRNPYQVLYSLHGKYILIWRNSQKWYENKSHKPSCVCGEILSFFVLFCLNGRFHEGMKVGIKSLAILSYLLGQSQIPKQRLLGFKPDTWLNTRLQIGNHSTVQALSVLTKASV